MTEEREAAGTTALGRGVYSSAQATSTDISSPGSLNHRHLLSHSLKTDV